MSLFSKIILRLKSPYPNTESIGEDLRGQLLAALVVASILYVFKPFGMSYYKGSALLISLLFGLVSFSVGLLIILLEHLVYKEPYNRPNYTLGKWIGEVTLLIIGIAIGNFLFSCFALDSAFSVYSFLFMLFATALIGMFPITLFGFRNQIKLERQNALEAKTLEKSITISEELLVNEKVILAVESMQNYIHIYQLESGELNKVTERLTLKAALDKFQSYGLVKCHRSYLVNTTYVREVSGNAQGLRLSLANADCPQIPVSRTYISRIKELLNS